MKTSTVASVFLFSALAVIIFFVFDWSFYLLSQKSTYENIGGLFFLIAGVLLIPISIKYLIHQKKSKQ